MVAMYACYTDTAPPIGRADRKTFNHEGTKKTTVFTKTTLGDICVYFVPSWLEFLVARGRERGLKTSLSSQLEALTLWCSEKRHPFLSLLISVHLRQTSCLFLQNTKLIRLLQEMDIRGQ
jgi:hypothetical protein